MHRRGTSHGASHCQALVRSAESDSVSHDPSVTESHVGSIAIRTPCYRVGKL